MDNEKYPALDRQLSERTTDKVSERNAKIWQTIADSYGARWNKSYGDLPPKVWCQLFGSLTDQHIQKAILGLVEHYPHHPPTLGEFYEIARIGVVRDAPLRDKPEIHYDKWHRGGQMVMLRVIQARKGVPQKYRDLMTTEKNRIVEQYRVIDADDNTPADWIDFIDTMDDRLEAVLENMKLR